MANNTRALRLKKSTEEFDEKFSDIKRLVRGLEKFVNEILSSVKSTEWNTAEASDDIDGELEIKAQFFFNSPDARVKFELWYRDEQLKKDSQFDLNIVRRVHNNLDVLIECAESICEDCGRLAEFQAKIARFE